MMSDEAQNYERIYQARNDHNATCRFGRPAIEVHMCPFDIGRLGWDDGDIIAGLLLVGSAKVAPDRLRIICDAEREQNGPLEFCAQLPQPDHIVVPDKMPEPVFARGWVP